MPALTIHLGPEMFRFDSFVEWDDHARARYRAVLRVEGVDLARLAAVDARGRLCVDESHYLRADREDAFPVVVHHVDPEWGGAGPADAQGPGEPDGG